MTDKQKALLAIDKALQALSNKEKLEILEQKRYEVSQKLNINESKMTNGTQGERVACEHLGLEWNSSGMNGCDAWDDNGSGVELKCFKTAATRANVNYTFPKRKQGEADANYAERVRQHYTQTSAGGHYWVLLSHGSTRYKQHWFVDNRRFAEAVKALLLKEPDREKINLGGVYCKDCGVPHRVAEISRVLRDKSMPAMFPTKVTSRCNGKFVKISF